MSTLTGTQVLLLVASETGHVYTFATPKLQPLITKQEGKNLIQACLNSPDSHSSIPEYLPVVSGSTGPIPTSQYDNELGDDELTPRSASTVVTSAQLHSYLPVNTTTNTTTPPSNSSAASVAAAAAAAQVFMSSAHPAQYAAYSQSNSASSGPYWNGNPNSGAMYAPVPGKSTQQSQQQLQQLQQSQQQQLYHAMYQQQHQQQQQQQLYQQYQQQQQQQQHQQHHHHQQQHHNTKQSESEDHQ